MKPALLLGVSFSLLAAACGSLDEPLFTEDPGGTKVSDAESLLAAEGTWHLVEEERSPTPHERHSDAKGGVNPQKTSMNKAFQADAEQATYAGDVNYRLLKLEREVTSLRADLGSLMRPLAGLKVASPELRTAIRDIDERYQYRKAQEAAKPIPQKPKPSAVKFSPSAAAKSAPVITGGPLRVTNVRFGQHSGGKTRMVLDLSGPAQFTSDLDNNEGILIVELGGAGWDTLATKTLTKNPLVASYSSQPSGNGGTTLVVELKKNAQVAGSAALKPLANPPKGHRIFIDLVEG